MILLLLAGCGPGVTWLDGEWTLDTWSATVTAQGATLFEATVEDAGRLRFEGDGEMWSSIAWVDLPKVIGGAHDLRVVDHVTWVYWWLHREEASMAPATLEMAWNQAYSGGSVWTFTERDASGFTATNTISYTMWPDPDGELTVTWRASRPTED